ncbi:MAG: hypothetical protein EBR82_79520 [Caulobacteraceae bacterium]|nr:hypothetical protein [bacterium]NBW21905.1 hypothetical protein [Caulobacteraceae bacterium]NDG19465.1 hypothetical protein [Betaproteobacteria bacterium]
MKIDPQKLAELQKSKPWATEELVRAGESLMAEPKSGPRILPALFGEQLKAASAYLNYRDIEIRTKMAKAKAEGRTLRLSEIEIR